MWQFIVNIGYWLVNHWPAIVTFLTSTTTIGFVATFLNLRSQNKSIKANTTATNELNKSTELMNDTKNTVDEMKASNDSLKLEVNTLKTELVEQRATNDRIVNKLTTVLEVMQLVYSTIKDETVRKAVTNLLIDAKYDETSTKVELEHEIDDLKTKLADTAEQLKTVVTEKLDNVKNIPVKHKNKTATRY